MGHAEVQMPIPARVPPSETAARPLAGAVRHQHTALPAANQASAHAVLALHRWLPSPLRGHRLQRLPAPRRKLLPTQRVVGPRDTRAREAPLETAAVRRDGVVVRQRIAVQGVTSRLEHVHEKDGFETLQSRFAIYPSLDFSFMILDSSFQYLIQN